jgi:hypothetical protein
MSAAPPEPSARQRSYAPSPMGRRLLTSMAPIAIQPSFMARPPYRADQLPAVCLVADIVACAWANPGQLPYASGGVGGLGPLAMIGLSRALGIEMNHIPFHGFGDSVQVMLTGTVPMLTAQANLVKRYGLHAVAVFAEHRSPDFPDTPTMREHWLDLV